MKNIQYRADAAAYSLVEKETANKISALRYLLGLTVTDDRHNEMQNTVEEIICDLKDHDMANAWYSATKNPPARGEVVEVTVQDGPDRYTCEAYIHAVSGRWSYGTGCGSSVDGKVIAWRPKSEPYQGEE